MLNLIKYEFTKKLKYIAMLLIVSVILCTVLAIKYSDTGFIIYLSFFPVIMFIIYIADVVSTYNKDLSQTSGYMLFMTPNSGYKIVWSKVITAILEGIGILILYFILMLCYSGYLSIKYGLNFEAFSIKDISYFIDIFLNSLGITFGHLVLIATIIFVYVVRFILTIYTSITIQRSILSNVKGSGILSFIIFIILNFVFMYIMIKFSNFFSTNVDVMALSAYESLVKTMPVLLLLILEIVIMSVGSGYLLEKRINL